MNKPRLIAACVILSCAIILSYGLPRVKYKSPDMVSNLEVPYRTGNWFGKDSSGALNLNDLRYNFISRVFARTYANRYGENLLFLILDAGNFHNPKVCFGSSGYQIKDLPDLGIQLDNGRKLKAKVIYAGKPDGEGFLLVYWISINKNVVDWTQQKLLQLWYSLFNKDKVGLMVRLDIPAKENNLKEPLKLALEFFNEIAPHIPPEQADYIFGK